MRLIVAVLLVALAVPSFGQVLEPSADAEPPCACSWVANRWQRSGQWFSVPGKEIIVDDRGLAIAEIVGRDRAALFLEAAEMESLVRRWTTLRTMQPQPPMSEYEAVAAQAKQVLQRLDAARK